jgi:hypothetical protein
MESNICPASERRKCRRRVKITRSSMRAQTDDIIERARARLAAEPEASG